MPVQANVQNVNKFISIPGMLLEVSPFWVIPGSFKLHRIRSATRKHKLTMVQSSTEKKKEHSGLSNP